MNMDKFNRLMAVPQLILAGLVCVQLYQNQGMRSEIMTQFEQLQTKTDRAIYSIQSQVENKFNTLRQQLDEDKVNNDRAFRMLNERVKNLESKPVVIFNGQQGFRTQQQSQQNTNQ